MPDESENIKPAAIQKPRSEGVDKIEKGKRIRIVMEYILDDYLSIDIEKQVMEKWKVTDRQARRYIREARFKLQEQDTDVIKNLRVQKIKTLEKLKRSLKDIHKGSPAGITAILRVEKEIAELLNLYPAKKVEVTGKDGQPIQTLATHKHEIDETKLSFTALEEIYKAKKHAQAS